MVTSAMDHEPSDDCVYCVCKIPHAVFKRLDHPNDRQILLENDDGTKGIGRATLRGSHYYIEIQGLPGVWKHFKNYGGIAVYHRINPTATARELQKEEP